MTLDEHLQEVAQQRAFALEKVLKELRIFHVPESKWNRFEFLARRDFQRSPVRTLKALVDRLNQDNAQACAPSFSS